MKTQFTDANFEELVLKNSLPVVVDFRADWCGPCKLLDPILEELTGEFSEKVLIGSINADENPQTGQKYNVMSIPTLIFFKNGVEVKRMVGYQGKEAVVKEINAVLG